MFHIVKDIHVDTDFCQYNRGAEFGHARHRGNKFNKLIIRLDTNIKFHFCLGNHIIKIIQMGTSQFEFFSLIRFDIVTFDSFNDFIGFCFCSFLMSLRTAFSSIDSEVCSSK